MIENELLLSFVLGRAEFARSCGRGAAMRVLTLTGAGGMATESRDTNIVPATSIIQACLSVLDMKVSALEGTVYRVAGDCAQTEFVELEMDLEAE